MTEFISSFAQNTWALIAEMAPYLLFGFAVAGLLHILIRPEMVQRLLGKPGIGAVVKACLIGVPMPLCSCSVIPVAASLRKSGASRGATAAFLSSTPQTGVDSIFATYSLLGGVFTVIRVLVAFVCGIVSGLAIELFCKKKKLAAPAAPSLGSARLAPGQPFAALGQSPGPIFASTSFQPTIAPATEPATKSCCSSGPQKQVRSLSEALRYGFIALPSDLSTSLIVGLVLAGLITTLMPTDLIHGAFSSGPLAFLLATAISLPLYVCATASIPMAYALMAAGLSPGAALIFLITGPATNTATIVTVAKMLGRKATFIYLGSLLIVSWLAGWLFNAALNTEQVAEMHHHAATQPALWQHLSGAVLVLLLLYGWKGWRPKKAKNKSCCHG